MQEEKKILPFFIRPKRIFRFPREFGASYFMNKDILASKKIKELNYSMCPILSSFYEETIEFETDKEFFDELDKITEIIGDSPLFCLKDDVDINLGFYCEEIYWHDLLEIASLKQQRLVKINDIIDYLFDFGKCLPLSLIRVHLARDNEDICADFEFVDVNYKKFIAHIDCTINSMDVYKVMKRLRDAVKNDSIENVIRELLSIYAKCDPLMYYPGNVITCDEALEVLCLQIYICLFISIAMSRTNKK